MNTNESKVEYTLEEEEEEIEPEIEFRMVENIYNAIMNTQDETNKDIGYKYYLTPIMDTYNESEESQVSVSRRLSRLGVKNSNFCSDEQYGEFVKKVQKFISQELHTPTLSSIELRNKWNFFKISENQNF
jgi:hypothetical protein